MPLVSSISTPAQFHDSLLAVIKGSSCSTKYTVSKNMYGHVGNSGPHKDFLDGHGSDVANGGRSFVWLSNYEGLQLLLNSDTEGCCSAEVTSLSSCGCQMAKASGTTCSNKDSFVVLRHPGHNGVPVSIPDWKRVVAAIPNTYKAVFGSSHLAAPTCGIAESMADTLGGFVEGENSWNGAVKNNAATAKELDLHPTSKLVEQDFGETGITNLTAAKFSALAKQGRFCDNPLAVRAYLARFMDCNPLFLGTGRGPTGKSEFITFTNPRLQDIGKGAEVTYINF